MCINEGDVKNTYGTGCFCIMNTGKKLLSPRIDVINCSLEVEQ